MSYEIAHSPLLAEPGVELSTLMKSPCLRFQGDFFAMMFDRAEALIIKVSPARVAELIESGKGAEFNFTKKTFKEWVMISLDYIDEFDDLTKEAMLYVQNK